MSGWPEIAKDRAELLDMMRALGIPIRHYKVLAGWVGEQLGRLKPNGHIVDRSPLSTLIELETMHLIVEGNGWRVLQQVADFDARLDRERLEGLPNRARQQADTLEALRIGKAAPGRSSLRRELLSRPLHFDEAVVEATFEGSADGETHHQVHSSASRFHFGNRFPGTPHKEVPQTRFIRLDVSTCPELGLRLALGLRPCLL